MADQSVVAEDEAQTAGIIPETVGLSAVVADFDGNGRPDIFLSRAGRFYLNNGNGSFSQVDRRTFPIDDRFMCVAVPITARPDIFCAIGSDHGGNGLHANEFWVQSPWAKFRGQSLSPSFENAADTYGLLDPTGRARAAIYLDVKGTSQPAVFVTNDPFRSDGLPDPDRLFLDTPSGFVDSPQYGLDLPIGGTCASGADYLRSGYEDLLVCSANGSLQLFQNDRGSGFQNVTAQAGLSHITGRDAVFADMNGDGWPDIVVVEPTRLVVLLQTPSTHVFRVRYTLPLSDGTSVATGDMNGDGSLDLLVTQGRGPNGTEPPNLALINGGSGTSYTSMPIPEPQSGENGHAFPINYVDNGLTDFLILNSPLQTREPVQLLTFFRRGSHAQCKLSRCGPAARLGVR